MQGCLLVLCFVWKARQRRLGVDDFGKPLRGREPTPSAPRIQPDSTNTTNTEADMEGQLHRQPTLGPAVVGHGRREDESTPLLSGARDGASSKGGLERFPWFGKK